MKKAGSVVFWLLIGVLVLSAAYLLYIRLRPAQLQVLPGNETTIGSETHDSSNTEEDRKEADNEDGEGNAVKAPGFQLKNLDGETVKLDDYNGKVVFLNFWALSCPYCVAEMPDLDEAHKELSKDGEGAVLTVNLGDNPEHILKFMEDEELSLPVLLDADGQVGRTYGVIGIPITFVINRDGTVYGYLSGAIGKSTILKVYHDLIDGARE